MKSFALKILLNTWFIAIFLGVIVFLAIPFHTDPYKAHVVVGDRGLGFNTHVQFYDLNSDGLDEMIETTFFAESKKIVNVVLKPNGNTHEQYNIDQVGTVLQGKCFIGDYNNDGFGELFSVFNRGNEIFVSVFSPFCEDSAFHNMEFKIYDVPQYSDIEMDLEIPDINLVNLFGDENLELVLVLYGRYETHDPRRTVAIEINSQKVLLSPQFGNTLNHLVFFDNNGDGKLEISGVMGSPNNNDLEQNLEYPDHTAWLMIFDNQLNLINNPVAFPGPFTTLYVKPVKRNGKTELAGLSYHEGKSDYPTYLFETKNLTEIIVKDTLEIPFRLSDEKLIVISDGVTEEFLVGSKSGIILFYDQDLNLLRELSLSRQIGFMEVIDINMDGKDEIILKDQLTNERVFLNSKGQFLTSILFENEGDTPQQMGVTTGLDGTVCYYRVGKKVYFITLQRNYWFYLKWLLLPGLIGFFLLLANIFKWIQRRQTKEKEHISRELKTLQLQSIKNQLNPHFTFNALNVLSYLSSKKDYKGVESFTHHFSKLIRRQLEMSDQTSVKLYDELRFVRHYIELQKLRFDVPIVYDEEIEPDIDMNLLIPKMMIHTHVENAIKHGIIPANGGEITIWIQRDKKSTRIRIVDNGSGRTRGSNVVNGDEESFSSGRGLKVLNQLYDLYYQLYKVKVKQKIIDLKDKDGNPSGTEIRITL